jgi:L-amino acid N-acyltransferase YncA
MVVRDAAANDLAAVAAIYNEGIAERVALAETSADQGLYKLTSRVFTDNAASRATHRAAGFREIGVQERHGKLDGHWKDCVLVERLIGAAAED